MDIVLEIADSFLLDKLYAKALPKDGAVAQYIANNFGSKNATAPAQGLHMPAPVTYLATLAGKLQRKDEVYGHFPQFFDFDEYTNASLLSKQSHQRVCFHFLYHCYFRMDSLLFRGVLLVFLRV